MFGLNLLLAGSEHLLLHWGIGGAIIIACVVLEIFTPAFLTGFKKDLLWVALGTSIFLFAEWIGGQDQIARCDAKAAVVNTHVDSVVTDANANPGTKRDKFETDK